MIDNLNAQLKTIGYAVRDSSFQVRREFCIFKINFANRNCLAYRTVDRYFSGHAASAITAKEILEKVKPLVREYLPTLLQD
jgi:hypothetical protein